MFKRRLSVSLVAISVAILAMGQTPTEAPTGFDTPTLVQNPGSKSTSNGIAEPPGDTYVLDQQTYETAHDPTTGLGPVFHARIATKTLSAAVRVSSRS